MKTSLAPQTQLKQGSYTILKELGSGGFSITYLAQNELGKKFTIKELFIHGHARRGSDNMVIFEGLDATQLERIKGKFKAEGELLLQLEAYKIPHIANVQNYFSEHNTFYLVLNYVEGQSLEAIVKKNGPVFLQELSPWINQIGTALAELHRNQFYHLDVKPGNIIITPQQEAVLIDFGLSRTFDPSLDKALTSMSFTERYAPPEQMNGRAKPHPTMDVYAFAGTICYALIGNTDFSPRSDDFASKLPGLSSQQVAALQKGLSLYPQERQQSIFDLVTALGIDDPGDRTVLPTANKKTNAQQSASGQSKPQPVLNRNWMYLAGLVVIILIGGKLWMNSQEDGVQNLVNKEPLGDTNSIEQEVPENKPTTLPDNIASEEEPQRPVEQTDNKVSTSASPAPTKAATSFAQRWTGDISKRGTAERHAVKLNLNMAPEKNPADRQVISGTCTVSDAEQPNRYATFAVTGHFDEANSNLHLETTSAIKQINFNYCAFKADFFYTPGAKTMEARFQPKVGSGTSRSACKAFRFNSKIKLQLQ